CQRRVLAEELHYPLLSLFGTRGFDESRGVEPEAPALAVEIDPVVLAVHENLELPMVRMPHRSIRTADSSRAPRKRCPMRMKRSGTSVTKKLVEPVPPRRARPRAASSAATARAVSSAESTSATRSPITPAITAFSSG